MLLTDPYRRLQSLIWRNLNPEGDQSRVVMTFILALISLNVFAIVLESHTPTQERFATVFIAFELLSATVFGVEYLARLWAAPFHLSGRYGHPLFGRLRYMLTPMAIIDLAATLPTFLGLWFNLDGGMLRALRIVRLLRIFKIARYSRAIELVFGALARKKEELVLTSFLLSILVILASTLIYLTERQSDLEYFGSIPTAMWWTIITLTSVGYGDAVPTTELGRVVGAIVSLAGIVFVALPSAMITSGFLEQLDAEKRARRKARRERKAAQTCPHCGEALDDLYGEDEDDD